VDNRKFKIQNQSVRKDSSEEKLNKELVKFRIQWYKHVLPEKQPISYDNIKSENE
jgi:hypothetical protein